jgi:hypothetical protein
VPCSLRPKHDTQVIADAVRIVYPEIVSIRHALEGRETEHRSSCISEHAGRDVEHELVDPAVFEKCSRELGSRLDEYLVALESAQPIEQRRKVDAAVARWQCLDADAALP